MNNNLVKSRTTIRLMVQGERLLYKSFNLNTEQTTIGKYSKDRA